MSDSYQSITPISQTTYAGGTRVSKSIVAGNTGVQEYKRLEKHITPEKSSKLGKMGIERICVSKDLIGNNFREKVIAFCVRDPEIRGGLIGEVFSNTDKKGIKKFLQILEEVKKSNSNLAGHELLQFVRKLCKIL